MEKNVLDLFKVMVIEDDARLDEMDTTHVNRGIVTDFTPTPSQLYILSDAFEPLDIKTLFTRDERENGDPFLLITKQLLHYLEVYGLNTPGLFNLETTSGKIVTMNFVRGVSMEELHDMVRELLYSNAPVKDSTMVAEIIKFYNVEYDVNKIGNNELRVLLFNINSDTFTSGDDVVRFMCFLATGDAMLIKCKDTIASVKAHSALYTEDFIERHALPLSQVFNRHKRIILAAKNKKNRTTINRVARMSKQNHVPIVESINKTFMAKALDKDFDMGVLSKIGVRDKFKFLNLLAFKREQLSFDAFVIRNGKMHVKTNRKVWDLADIDRVEKAVIDSLSHDLAYLKDKQVLVDANVKYGLPISRKQTVGQLPFGSSVKVDKPQISAGIYWENEWGATDLDLSTVDDKGQRTGWGSLSGYDKTNPVTFSGDVTDATSGAMEFMTSSNVNYGLFVNIFSGKIGCDMEVVVGTSKDKQSWINDTLVREKIKLGSRGMVVGFVREKEFVFYTGRLNNKAVSTQGKDPMVARGMADLWTVNKLFDAIGIEYDVTRSDDAVYDYELGYDRFSYDKLEDLLLKQ